MNLWQIWPDARHHLMRLLDDALSLNGAAKVEQLDDGTLAVTAPAHAPSPGYDNDRHEGIDVITYAGFRPGADRNDELVTALTVALHWQHNILVTATTDDDGPMWIIQTPRPDATDEAPQDLADADHDAETARD